MPRLILSNIHETPDFQIGLWNVSEDEETLILEFPELNRFRSKVDGIKSKSKRLEYLVERILLKDMLGTIPEVFHEKSGKPFIQEKRHISISHTRGYVAVMLSDSFNVAIDMEYPSERVCRVAEKFLRNDEKADTPFDQLVCWCSKETLYKLHSSDNLSFHEMRVTGIPLGSVRLNEGCLYIENVRRSKKILVRYMATPSYILTYAMEKDTEIL